MSLITTCAIVPCDSGFGEYETGEYSEQIDYSDWVNGFDCDYYDLDDDNLPDGIEDIRGKIHYEPSKIYALITDFGVQYVGFEIEE